MHAKILKAIDEKRLLGVFYDPGYRIVEPCAYGQSSEGNDLLRAFQTGGASASGEHVHWKLFRADRIRQIELLDEHFVGDRPEYRRNDKAMRRGIYRQL